MPLAWTRRVTGILAAARLGLDSTSAPPVHSAPARLAVPEAPTEVVVIGTMHSSQLVFESVSPAHLRALLSRIDPAAVGVETSPGWYEAGVYFEIAYESYGVGVPWARDHGRSVRPIDWQPAPSEIGATLAWPAAPAGQDEGASLYPPLPGLWLGDPAAPFDLLFAEGQEWGEPVLRAAYNTPRRSPGADAVRRYLAWRNLHMAGLITATAAEVSGQRVVVLVGAAHKPDLDRFLGTVPNVVVRQASEWGRPSPAEVAAEERRADHLAILWFNLASKRAEVAPQLVDLARMEGLLRQLEAEADSPGADPELRFLRARWQALRGQPRAALDALAALAWGRPWEDRAFTYPDRALAERMQRFFRQHKPAHPHAALPAGGVLSPVANLTVRQRILFELARQGEDGGLAERARRELLGATGLNETQVEQVRALLAAGAAGAKSRA